MIPDGVRLRGESRELVAVHFREAPKPQDAPKPGYVYSDGGEGHGWALEEITLYISAFYHSVVFVHPTCTSFSKHLRC